VLTLNVALEEANDPGAMADRLKDRATAIQALGILALPLDSETAALVEEPRYRFGSIVAAKLESGSSFVEDLQPGDVIYGLNGKRAADLVSLKELLAAIDETAPLVAQVQREGVLRYLLLRGE